jgi:predicted phosphodiesterase
MPRRVAVIADVHANLPALAASLADIRAAACDEVYCLGDVIGIGPYPAECLALLLADPTVRCVMGNHDAWFATGLPEPLPPGMGPAKRRTTAGRTRSLTLPCARWSRAGPTYGRRPSKGRG